MHTDVWYELRLRELSDEDAVSERLREAEAVQLPGAKPKATPEEQKAPPVEDDWTC